MAKVIENRLAKILACRKNSSEKEWFKAYDMAEEIGKFGKQKKYRDEAVTALKVIARNKIVSGLAWSPLADLVTAKDTELQEYLRGHLHDDRAAYDCAAALIKLHGRQMYSDAIDIVCDSRLSGNTRVSVLSELSEHSAYPFDEMLAEYDHVDDITDADLPLDQLQQWRDAGYPKYVEPKIEIPTRQLQKAGVVLPDDYLQFLAKHHGKDRLEFEASEWDLLTAAQLFEPSDVDGRQYPGIGVLAGYVASMSDAFADGQTVDSKEKPYSLDRLASGIAIGSSDAGDVLYLDPADGYSVWVFHRDGGDVAKVGKTFTAWKRKTRKAWS